MKTHASGKRWTLWSWILRRFSLRGHRKGILALLLGLICALGVSHTHFQFGYPAMFIWVVPERYVMGVHSRSLGSWLLRHQATCFGDTRCQTDYKQFAHHFQGIWDTSNHWNIVASSHFPTSSSFDNSTSTFCMPLFSTFVTLMPNITMATFHNPWLWEKCLAFLHMPARFPTWGVVHDSCMAIYSVCFGKPFVGLLFPPSVHPLSSMLPQPRVLTLFFNA